MTDVTFIGLGLMGTALAQVALRSGYKITVWNRTGSKADMLVADGAHYVANVAQAISKSPLVVVCVGDYDISDQILKTPDCTLALNGRTLVQLTNGSARLANEAAKWVSAAGARYVDGGIEGYPDKIGEAESMFIVCGNQQGFREAEPLLRTLAPILHYLGDDPGRASAMYSAMLAGSFGLIFGVMNAVAICEATGISIKQYLEIVGPVFRTDAEMVSEMAIKCDQGKLDETEAYLSVWNETLDPIIETLDDNGCNPELPKLMKNILDRAEKKGFANHDLAALIEMIRPMG